MCQHCHFIALGYEFLLFIEELNVNGVAFYMNLMNLQVDTYRRTKRLTREVAPEFGTG
jgi:hypothetical protein